MGLRVLVAAHPAPIPAPPKNSLVRIEVFGFNTWSTLVTRCGIESYRFLTTFDQKKQRFYLLSGEKIPNTFRSPTGAGKPMMS